MNNSRLKDCSTQFLKPWLLGTRLENKNFEDVNCSSYFFDIEVGSCSYWFEFGIGMLVEVFGTACFQREVFLLVNMN